MNEDLSKDVNQQVITLQNTTDFANRALGLYKECKEIEAKVKITQEWSKVEIAKTVAKYKTCELFLTQTFAERRQALNKHYDVLDCAIKNDDRNLIIAALEGISRIVTKSPLEEFQQFVALYNDTSRTLLDF